MVKHLRLKYLIALFTIWQLVALIIDTELFPTPIMVAKSLWYHLVYDELLYHLGVTLYRVTIAFFTAMIIGIAFGMLMGSYKKVDEALDSLLILGLNIPAIVSIMLCYIWFGLTDFSAILAVVLNKVPIVIVTVREGARAINVEFMHIAKVYKLSKVDTFFKIYSPQIYPYIMASARGGLSLIWKIVLVVELLGRSDGIGFQLSMFFQFFDITSILAYSFGFIIIILFIESFMLIPLEKKSNLWRRDA